MASSLKDVATDSVSTNVLVFANYYVTLTNANGDEKNVNTVKGGFDTNRALHVKALEAIKADPSRLLSRPTLSTGEKIYVDDSNFDADDWS